MSLDKTRTLFQIAQKTLSAGDRQGAAEMLVLAFSEADAIDALDKLLPSVPEKMDGEEYEEIREELTQSQLERIAALAADIPGDQGRRVLSLVQGRLGR